MKVVRVLSLAITLVLMVVFAAQGRPFESAVLALVLCLKFWVLTIPDDDGEIPPARRHG